MSPSSDLLATQKYLSLTTFKRDGSPKATPIWIVDAGNGTLGFTTASSSWKIKRIRNGSRVLLQPSDSRGRALEGSSEVTATAIVATGPDFERVAKLVATKYGWQFSLVKLIGKAAKLAKKGSGTDIAVLIELAP